MSRRPYVAIDYNDFRRGQMRMLLEWSGGSAEALLFDEGVPRTTGALVRSMPLTVPVIHAAWSGDMLMSTHAIDLGIEEFENNVRLVRPGDLTWDPKFGELAFTYGTAECRIPAGPNTLVVYGYVVSGLDAFATYGRARRFEGQGELQLSLAG
jgi:hypothetical protein